MLYLLIYVFFLSFWLHHFCTQTKTRRSWALRPIKAYFASAFSTEFFHFSLGILLHLILIRCSFIRFIRYVSFVATSYSQLTGLVFGARLIHHPTKPTTTTKPKNNEHKSMKVNRWILTIVARSDSESESECEWECDSVSMSSVYACLAVWVVAVALITFILYFIVVLCVPLRNRQITRLIALTAITTFFIRVIMMELKESESLLK